MILKRTPIIENLHPSSSALTPCRSMSNDLESPDSPKSVIRTYSNAARREGSVRQPDRSLRVLAINNNYKGGESETGQEIEMSDIQVADSIVERKR